jgi:hypothetical protein
MNSENHTQIKLKDPIFICGEGRSGTKLLRDTLARHSGINFFRCETYIFVKSNLHRIKNLDEAEKSGDLDYLIKSVLACILSKNKNQAAKAIKTKSFNPEIETLCFELKKNYDLSFDKLDIFDKVAHLITIQKNKQRWLEKTPFHIYYLDEIFSKYPQAKVILTVRDPKAVYASWKKKDKNKSLIGVSKSWNKVANTILQAKEKYPNIFLLRFEDLVSCPKEELTKLCEFIEEDFEESLLNAEVVNSKFEENKRKGFDKEIINRWQNQLSIKEMKLIDHLCMENENKLGYKASRPDLETTISLIDYIYYYISYIIKKIIKLLSWLRI